MEGWLRQDLRQIPVPRYLFRAFSRTSQGHNSQIFFKSVAVVSGYERDICHISKHHARTMLTEHLQWRNSYDDNLISFTSSLLWVLQHCVRKTAYDTQLKGQADVQLALVDTSKFPPGTFIPTTTLLEHLGLSEQVDPNLKHDYHEVEYLAQGTLEVYGFCQVVPWDILLRNGLFELVPELDEPPYRYKLLSRVRELRRIWYSDEITTSDSELEQARTQALCFGGEWYLPMVVWFLALKARPQQDLVVQEEFREGFWGRYSAWSSHIDP